MEKRRKVMTIILSLLLMTIICPVLTACLYAVPSADDFANALGWQNYEGWHIRYMLSELVNIYKNWQGNYFGVFVCLFPIHYCLGLISLRVWLFGVTLLFLAAVFLFGISFSRIFRIENGALFYITLFLFYVLSTNNLDQIFYWFTGACIYTLPICVSLFCISFYMLYETSEKRLFLILGIVFAFLAAGGALDIAALLCSILLFGILYNYLVLRKISKSIWIGLTALIGSIINAVAPGNYVRHAYFDEKIRPLMAIGKTLMRVNHIIVPEFRNGLLLAIIVVSFVIAFEKIEKGEFAFSYPGLVTLYCYIGIVITDFPVTLGYSSTDFPSRCSFVEHIAIAAYLILTSVYWAGWVKNKEIFRFTREIYLLLAMVCIIPLSAYFDPYSLRDLTPYKMIWHLAKGDYRVVAEREESIIKQINESSESNVIVYVNRPDDEEWVNIKQNVSFSEDNAYLTSSAVAQYYGKNSITIQCIE